MTSPVKCIPTLSDRGFVTNVDEMIDRLLSYFFVINQKQTIHFQDSVYSIQSILAKAGNDIDAIKTGVQNGLERLLQSVFDAARVTVSAGDDIGDYTSGTTLRLNIAIREAGVDYNVVRSVQRANSTFKNLMTINNGA